MRKVDASAAVEAGLRGTLVDVRFAELTGKSGRAEALGTVVNGSAETAVVAHALGANHVLASVFGSGSGRQGFLGGVAFEAGALSAQGLEEVDGAGSAGSQTGVGVGAGFALGATFGHALCAGLESERSLGTVGANFESVGGRWAREGVPRAAQARHEAGGAVGAVAADGNAFVAALGAFVARERAFRTLLALSLSGLVLEGTSRARRALAGSLEGKETGRALQATWHVRFANGVQHLTVRANETSVDVRFQGSQRRTRFSHLWQLQKFGNDFVGALDGQVEDEVVRLTAKVVHSGLREVGTDHHQVGQFEQVVAGFLARSGLEIDGDGNATRSGRAPLSQDLADGFVELGSVIDVLAQTTVVDGAVAPVDDLGGHVVGGQGRIFTHAIWNDLGRLPQRVDVVARVSLHFVSVGESVSSLAFCHAVETVVEGGFAVEFAVRRRGQLPGHARGWLDGHLEVASGLVAGGVSGNDGDVFVTSSANGGSFRQERDGDFSGGIRSIDLTSEPLEIDVVSIVFVDQLDDEGLRARQGRGRVVRHRDVHLADGHVSVEVVGVVLDHHVLKGRHGHGESFGTSGRSDGHHFVPGNGSRIVLSERRGEVDRQISFRTLLHLVREGRAVQEGWRFVVHADRITVVVTQVERFFSEWTTHQLEFQARVFVVRHDAEDDELGADRQRQGDHGQLSVVSGVSSGQIKVGEVHDVVVFVALFVEESEFGRASHNVVGDHTFDQDGLDHGQFIELDADVSKRLLQSAPTCDGIQSDVSGLVVASLASGIDGAVRDRSRGDSQRSHDFALRLSDAFDRRRVDWNVAVSFASKGHF